jgi:hypothetical protein
VCQLSYDARQCLQVVISGMGAVQRVQQRRPVYYVQRDAKKGLGILCHVIQGKRLPAALRVHHQESIRREEPMHPLCSDMGADRRVRGQDRSPCKQSSIPKIHQKGREMVTEKLDSLYQYLEQVVPISGAVSNSVFQNLEQSEPKSPSDCTNLWRPSIYQPSVPLHTTEGRT